MLYFAILMGGVLIFLQYVQNRGMWLDEILMLEGILDAGYADLVKPLDNGQMAPLLYVLIIKLISSVFGSYDMILRILPLSTIFLSTILLYRIGKKILVDKTLILFAIALFLLNPMIIYYSSEMKPYSMDILASLLLLYCTQRVVDTSDNWWKFTLIGFALFYVSFIPVIILPAAGLLLFIISYKAAKEVKKRALVSFGTWVIAFISYFLLFLRNNGNQNVMYKYWEGKGLPNAGLVAASEYLSWLFDVLNGQLIRGILSYENKIFMRIFLALFFVGFLAALSKRNWKLLIISLIPMGVHITLSLLSIYPFWKRLVLFHIPLYILVAVYGWQYILKWLENRQVKLGIYFSFLPAILSIGLVISNFRYIPKQLDYCKTGIQYLNQNIGKGERVYIYSAEKSYPYYKSTVTFPKRKIHLIGSGTAPKYKDIMLMKELELKGEHWFLFCHGRQRWKKRIRNMLNKEGECIDSVGGYLYKYRF